MADIGGIGAFAGNFAKSYGEGVRQRRLKDQLDLENKMKLQREKRMSDQFEQQQNLRVEQHQALQEWRGNQQVLQQKQMEFQQKSMDLQTMGAWDKILDPNKPKAMRKFMFKQMSSTLGIDPKSQQSKDFEAMLSGMDDESLAEVRTQLLTLMPNASPGQITAFSKAIVGGQMEMKDALEAFGEQSKSKRTADALSLGGGAAGAGEAEQGTASPVNPTASISPTPMSQQSQPPPGGNMPVPGMEQQTRPQETTHTFTPEQLRKKAIDLAQNPDIETEQVNLFISLARDMEKANETKLQLKQIVETAPDGTRTEKWVPAEEAVGKEAPSGRPVPSKEEARAAREGEALADLDIERLKPIHEKADTARELIPQIETYRSLLKTGKFETGSFAGLRESVGRIARLTGAPDEVVELLDAMKVGDPAIAEAMSTVSNQMGLTFAGDVSRLTNMSLSLITGAIPSLLKTPEGNDIVLEVYESKAKQSIEIEELAEQYKDQYGTLRPKGKPSFFEERAKIMRKSLLKPNFEERFMEAKKKGEGIDIDKIINTGKSSLIELIDEDGEKVQFETVGKHEKGLPLVKLRDGQNYPYAATPKDAAKLPSGTMFLRQDPIKGPVLWKKQ